MSYAIQATSNRLPVARAGQYLAVRNATQETWADSTDRAKRFATQQAAQAAILYPGSESAVVASV